MGMFGKVKAFIGETVVELKKTTWPTRSEFKRATIVVLAGALFIGFFVAVADFALFQVVNLLLDVVR
ncbi:MAG: preprotein translocase subunit SecE [Puniceicoccales bacterium]|jgi:preprotein translocase SecE subunit|nr:preprotein translocase subunit SecE [Puniceicoccales bacterium]